MTDQNLQNTSVEQTASNDNSDLLKEVEGTYRFQTFIPSEWKRKLIQIKEQKPANTTLADLGREAIGEYIQRQEDAIGSRAHFGKSMRNRLDQLEENLKAEVGGLVEEALKPYFQEIADRDDAMRFYIELGIQIGLGLSSKLGGVIEKTPDAMNPQRLLDIALQDTQKARRKLSQKSQIVRTKVEIE